eukprot:jgi/Tetstr1/427591/TSEL_017716.t1
MSGHFAALLNRTERYLETERANNRNKSALIDQLKAKIAELEAQVAAERAAKEAAERHAAEMEALLEQSRAETELVEQTLTKLQERTNLKLTWKNVIQKDSPWFDVIPDLTGMHNAEVLQALYNWLNWNGQAHRLRYWNGKATIKRMKAVINGSAKRKSVGRHLKALTPEDAMLATLVKLRTGLSTKVISSWMGVPLGTLSRVFMTWISFMDRFFRSEFPIPTVEQMQGPEMEEWKKAYGTNRIRFILDCTELRVQQPCSRKASMTLFSYYKHYHTAKLLAGILPLGAYCGTSEAYPGRIDDLEIFEQAPFKDILQRGDCIPTEKGFDKLAETLQGMGCQMAAPVRRMQGRKTYTSDERAGNKGQSNLRIHVERHFSRLQGWGFFSQKKIPLFYTDILAKIFNVVGHLCNLYKPLRNKDDAGALAESMHA